jgi:hypothetical protein
LGRANPPPQAVSEVRVKISKPMQVSSEAKRLRFLKGRRSSAVLMMAAVVGQGDLPGVCRACCVALESGVWTDKAEEAPSAPGVTEGGVKVAAAPVGSPETESVTALVKVLPEEARLIA